MMIFSVHGVLEWPAESQPANPVARVRFPAWYGILISILGLCVAFVSVLSCVFSGSDSDILLTTYFRMARPCVYV